MTNVTVHADSPLPASKAFAVQVTYKDSNNFLITWQIKPGYFLYKDRIHLTNENSDNLKIAKLILPIAEVKTVHNQSFSVFRHQLILPVSILGKKVGNSIVSLSYQGCSDGGFCYPPEVMSIKLYIDNSLSLTKVSLFNPNSTAIEHTTNSPLGSFQWLGIFSAFGLGLLLAFTPCVLPMIPVLSGIIIGTDNPSFKRSFLLSLTYVLSMSITYALVGALIAKAGSNLQIIMQSPWAIGLFSLVFLILAGSMFGWYNIELPAKWRTYFINKHNNSRSRYLNTAIMGSLSILILSPCVSAPLIGVLSYIAQTGNLILGAITLFFLSLGMGLPLLLVGASAGFMLPKAGRWMNSIKHLFGIIFIGMAIYLLQRIVPSFVSMSLWAGWFIFSSVFVGTFHPTYTLWEKLCQTLGIVFLTYGIVIFLGGILGNINPLAPLANLKPSSVIQTNTVRFFPKVVRSVPELKQALASADRPIFIDYYARWCQSCQAMEHEVLTNPTIQSLLSQFSVIKIDVSDSIKSPALLAYYNAVAPPTFLFLSLQSKTLAPTLVGEVSIETLQKQLSLALSKQKTGQSLLLN